MKPLAVEYLLDLSFIASLLPSYVVMEEKSHKISRLEYGGLIHLSFFSFYPIYFLFMLNCFTLFILLLSLVAYFLLW